LKALSTPAYKGCKHMQSHFRRYVVLAEAGTHSPAATSYSYCVNTIWVPAFARTTSIPLAQHPNGFWIIAGVVLTFTASAGAFVLRMKNKG
jgi:hypothetical protein